MNISPHIGTYRDMAGQSLSVPNPITHTHLTRDRKGVKRCLPLTPVVPVGCEGREAVKEPKKQAKAPTPSKSPVNTIAARVAVVAGTKCWIEAARRLHAAGFSDAAISMALEAGVERDAKQVTA